MYRFIADFGVFLSTPSARRATSTSSLSRTGWSGFLSTPSARRATLSQGVKSGKSVYFYPRPPRGGRQVRHTSLTGNGHISIHALREEGDSPAFCGEGSALVFLSTPSARRATSEIAKSNISVLFLSTPSARRATPASRCTFHPTAHFYPRPPRGGRQWDCYWFSCFLRDFYPRPPRGGRQQKQRQNLYFLINYTTFCTNLEEP